MTVAPHEWPGALSSRDDWVALSRDLTAPALRFQSEGLSELDLTGAPSWHGARADGLEAFARVFLLDALSGCLDTSIDIRTQRLLDGIAVGVGASENRWIRPARNLHAVVEAPSLCIGLWVGGHRLWRGLTAEAQEGMIRWLTECADPSREFGNNWMLFPFVISRFLDSVGHPLPERSATEGRVLSRLSHLYRGNGWYSDGGPATFDYYNSFTFHYYPGLLGHLSGDGELREMSIERLALYLPSLVTLLSSGGAPVYFGRSMSYRFAVAAPLSIAGILGLRDARDLRETSARVIRHSATIGGMTRGTPLSPGWGPLDTDLVQDYSGPGAAYWASRAFVNLLLPAGDPYWTEGPPTSGHSPPAVTRLAPPNFLVEGSPTREIVRMTNHGSYDTNVTDIKSRADDPFYGRLFYSSETVPLVRGMHADATFTVIQGGHRYRRARVESLDGGEDWATSLAWLRDLESAQDLPEPAVVCSVAVAPWTVHLLHLPGSCVGGTVTFGGWVIDDPTGEAGNDERGPSATVSTSSLTSSLHGLVGFTTARLVRGTRGRGGFVLPEVVGIARGDLMAVATLLERTGTHAPPPPTLRRAGRGAWQLTGRGVARRRIRLRDGRFTVA